MRQCNTCIHFDSEYEAFRTTYDDVIVEGKKKDHFCPLYDDVIPQKIWYEEGKCPYYRDKEDE